MAKTLSKRGFGVLGVLLVIIVLASVAATAWLVYRQAQPPPAKQSAAQESAPRQPLSPDPTEGGKYLVIKEWGVRIPLSEDLRGDTDYGIRKNVLLGMGDEPAFYGDVAYFTSKKLAATPASSNDCGLKPGAQDDLLQRADPHSYDGGPGIALSRSRQKTHEYAVLIKDYWYGESKGSAARCYAGSDGSQEQAFLLDMIPALRGVQPSPSPD